jgi:hypothetical protein
MAFSPADSSPDQTGGMVPADTGTQGSPGTTQTSETTFSPADTITGGNENNVPADTGAPPGADTVTIPGGSTDAAGANFTLGDTFGLDQGMDPTLLALAGEVPSVSSLDVPVLAGVTTGNVLIPPTENVGTGSQEQFTTASGVVTLPDVTPPGQLLENIGTTGSGTGEAGPGDAPPADGQAGETPVVDEQTVDVPVPDEQPAGGGGPDIAPQPDNYVPIENIINDNLNTKTEQVRDRGRIKIIYEK